MSYNKKAHLLINMEIIKIAFNLDREKRRATNEEMAILQKYSGFGGIKCILKSSEEKNRLDTIGIIFVTVRIGFAPLLENIDIPVNIL